MLSMLEMLTMSGVQVLSYRISDTVSLNGGQCGLKGSYSCAELWPAIHPTSSAFQHAEHLPF